MGKKWGDRKDGQKLRNIHAMHFVMPLMYPNRCDNEAFISERIDLTSINAYLERKNAENPEYAYNLFQVMVTAVLKTITLRPKMNRFIANNTMYLHNDVSASFTVNKFSGIFIFMCNILYVKGSSDLRKEPCFCFFVLYHKRAA